MSTSTKSAVFVAVIGAAITAVGIVQSVIGVARNSHGWVWPSPFWAIPVLIGAVASLLVLLRDERHRHSALHERISDVEHRLALGQMQVRIERIEDGPPSLHTVEFRLPVHNAAGVPVRWELRQKWIDGEESRPTTHATAGTIAPGADGPIYLLFHLRNPAHTTPGSSPPRVVRMGLEIHYGAAYDDMATYTLRRVWQFDNFVQTPDRGWANIDGFPAEERR